jgi:hypothetical protein
LRVIISNYKVIKKGFLEASLDVTVPDWGIEIRDIKLFNKEGSQWLSYPSREYEKDGKKSYFSYVKFSSIEIEQDFQRSVIDSISPSISQPLEKRTQYNEERYRTFVKDFKEEETLPF